MGNTASRTVSRAVSHDPLELDPFDAATLQAVLQAGQVISIRFRGPHGLPCYHFAVVTAVPPEGANAYTIQIGHFCSGASPSGGGCGTDRGAMVVRRTPLAEMVQMADLGARLRLNKAPRDVQHAADIVERARHVAMDLDGVFAGQPYNVITNNCEHFAYWCYNGHEAFSEQVDQAKAALQGGVKGVGGIVALTAAAGMALSRR
ncbi:hypothetical protein HYH03_012638 [Edaphochlamys debaryana]|uniref:LRAT domain-containing protein n=1 Tax=Edaphochlamys debaryana TaxID=47281 RepID=A0A835XV19_9CHLO|nr:hypothetical protein HYH03_012638 [Edaphochlamys debaryana]|eukprot:KAG2488841.1 hypothetical protein HYH03_012638 [Edaphochlamys debaryana]